MIAEKEPAGMSMGVAALLRETRIKQGRDVAVVATTLRIRQPYLQAIEDGRFEDLPGSTYAVGFVRAYAEFLGLDGAEIVRRFKQENSDLAGRAELVFPSATSGGGIPTGALLGIAVVGALVAYGLWYFLQDHNDTVAEAVPPLPERLAAMLHKPVDQDAPQTASSSPESASPQTASPAPQEAMTPQTMAPTSPAPAPEVQQSAPEPAPAPTVTPEPAKPVKQARKTEAPKVETPAAPTAMAESPPAPAGDNPSAAPASADQPAADAPKADKVVWKTSKRVRLKASADCWIKIRDAEGKVVLSRLLHAGDSFAPPGNAGLTMTVGNAGALVVALDGNDLPALGAEGQVKKVALDPEKLGGAPDTPGND